MRQDPSASTNACPRMHCLGLPIQRILGIVYLLLHTRHLPPYRPLHRVQSRDSVRGYWNLNFNNRGMLDMDWRDSISRAFLPYRARGGKSMRGTGTLKFPKIDPRRLALSNTPPPTRTVLSWKWSQLLEARPSTSKKLQTPDRSPTSARTV
ncbi:hypothetical protein B0T21DRAFT_212580 [Apiosordaria backusii]|uniref:Uncharacterized protein n=1 Tax=Apiosordaria backusii TaxID=314023 RepID=A0AA40B856_9PEZI|nr:hypothetical protein B0T21DRAFT_212580 [Apiosordaria backusii]